MANVLIVDDEEVFRRALRRYLEVQFGWTVHEAGNADEAIDLIPTLELDGIVLDRKMPDKNGKLVDSGDDVMRWLYDHHLLCDICVVMLTGFGELKSASSALSMGAWQYLEKPLYPQDIYRLLAPGIALKKCHRLRRRVASEESAESIVNWIQEVVQQTLAPDFFHVYFLLDDMCRDMMDGQTVSGDRRFVREIRSGKSFLYASTREEVRAYDPVLPDAGTLMAVRVVTNQTDAYGVVVMESRQEGAFDPRWQEVLAYLADLVGLSETIRRATQEKIAAERWQRELETAARDREIESLRLLNRELRHRLSTSIGAMYQHVEAILEELGAKGTEPGIVVKAQVVQKHLKTFVDVMKELRDATSPVRVAKDPCLLSDLASAVLAEKQRDFDGAGVTVGFGVVDDSVVVLADRPKLEYCLRCILQNAVEAVAEGHAGARAYSRSRAGSAEMEADLDAVIDAARSRPTAAKFDVTISILASEGSGEIRVRDEGIGFDEEIKKRLFTPLFTTKLKRDTDSANDGMGLYTVKRLIEAMKGEILARSNGVKAGAEFMIRLRLATEG